MPFENPETIESNSESQELDPNLTTPWNAPETISEDSEPKPREENLLRLFGQTAFALFVVVACVVVLSVFFRENLISLSESLVHTVGYPGLFFGMLLSDSLPAFIPPDAFLVFSIAGSMHWFGVLFSCSVGSILGGSVSYAIGRYLIPRFSLGRKFILRYEDRLLPYLRRFGFWAIVLAAMTPIPYSWMAYTVGSFKMRYKYFLLGSLFRIPRMTLYYFAMLWGWM